MYEIRHAGAKGLGVFATKQIPRGTRILAEKPIFTVKSDRDIYPALRSISSEDRNGLQQLSKSGNPRPPSLEWAEAAWHIARGSLSRTATNETTTSSLPRPGITEYTTLLANFRNNSFNIGSDTRAIFRQISRINHSCVPNSQGNFNTALGAFTIHAMRPIDARQEITISYLDEHGAVRAPRQGQLIENYGFECTCPVCDLQSSRARESEKRRAGVRDRLGLFVEQASQRKEADPRGELEMLKLLIRMFEEEGILGRELSTMYLSAAEGSLKLGDREEAKRLSRLGLDMEEACLGTDSPLFKESLQRMRGIPRE